MSLDPQVKKILEESAALGLPAYHDLSAALIITAEYDPLRDEGEGYGKRLQEAE